ncbi:hypothetical protein FRC06_008359, partial [Ceratobasidium sp. 370]
MGTRCINQVNVIDPGLAKKYCDPGTRSCDPYRENKNLTGTVRYTSISPDLSVGTNAMGGSYRADRYCSAPNYGRAKQTAHKPTGGKAPRKQLATKQACKSAKHPPVLFARPSTISQLVLSVLFKPSALPPLVFLLCFFVMPPETKYTLREFEAQLARRGRPLAEGHAARKTKKAAPSVFDLEPNLDIDDDLDDDDDVSAPLGDNDGGKEPASKGANIIVHWCDKPKGSPGRGASGYNLKKKLGMPDRSYRLVL